MADKKPVKKTGLLPMTKRERVSVGKSAHPGTWGADGSGYPIPRRPVVKEKGK